MKRQRKASGHSFSQQKAYEAQLKKDGVNPKDKVFLKNGK